MNEQDLTTGSVTRHLLRLSIPVTIGYFFHTMYNVVDTYFAGMVSTEALAALSLSFPIFFFIIAVSVGVSTGTTALIANALGKGSPKEARILSAQALSFSLINSLGVTVCGLLFAPSLYQFLGAQDDFLALSLEYIEPIFWASTCFVFVSAFSAILTASGNTKPFRNFLVISFFLNLILDPWFLYGGFGLPPMGVFGIGLATAVIEFFGMLYMGYEASKTGLLKGWLTHAIPKPDIILRLFSQGTPAALSMLTIATGFFVANYFAAMYGKHALAAFSIGSRVVQVVLMLTIGFHTGVLALVGQNNGAGLRDRVLETKNKAIKICLSVILPGSAIIFLFPAPLVNIFSNDPSVIDVGVGYLRIEAITLWAYVLININVTTLQGMERPLYALVIGVLRQLVLPIPLISYFVFVAHFPVEGIWWGHAIATWIAAVITFRYAATVLKNPLPSL